ncbi:hypothetical protein TYRP_020901, partial [Tyrophagus putrescentiae]
SFAMLSLTVMFLCILTFVSQLAFGAKLKENCGRNVLDDCSKKLLMLSDETFVFPAFIFITREIKPLEKCIKDYSTRCLDGEARSSLNVVLYGIIKTNKSYCNNNKKKNAFITFGKCANANKPKLDQLMNILNKDTHGARLAKDPRMRLPFACWYFKSSVIQTLDQDCPGEALELERVIDGYSRAGSGPSLWRFHVNSDKCDQIIKKTPMWTKPLESKVFIVALVEILNSL